MDICCKGFTVGLLARQAENLGAKVFLCSLGVGHFGFARQLKRILVEGKYDLLHNHVETYSGFPVWVAHQLNIPVITSFHNTKLDPQISLTRLPLVRQLRSIYRTVSIDYALRNSEVVTGCSQGVLKSIDPQGRKIKHNSLVLYYGVNLPKLSTPKERTAFRESFGWTAQTPLILHVGRLIEQKNHLGMLSIFELVLAQIPKAKLLLVGEGSLRSSIENTIAEKQLSQSVLLLGLRDDVSSLMSKCDVFLFPSIYEGFGLVAIEANAANLPVVGSKIPGLMEAVRDGKTAKLHDLEDTEAMAESILKLVKDSTYAQQIGTAGRTWVKDNYSTEMSANQLLKMYGFVTNRTQY